MTTAQVKALRPGNLLRRDQYEYLVVSRTQDFILLSTNAGTGHPEDNQWDQGTRMTVQIRRNLAFWRNTKRIA